MRKVLLLTICISYIFLIMISNAGARPYLDRSRDSLINYQDPEEVANILQNIEETLGQSQNAYSNVKRNLDLGFSRGFSGSQAAKHLMGLAAANFAGGPGRKRREATDEIYPQN